MKKKNRPKFPNGYKKKPKAPQQVVKKPRHISVKRALTLSIKRNIAAQKESLKKLSKYGPHEPKTFNQRLKFKEQFYRDIHSQLKLDPNTPDRIRAWYINLIDIHYQQKSRFSQLSIQGKDNMKWAWFKRLEDAGIDTADVNKMFNLMGDIDWEDFLRWVTYKEADEGEDWYENVRDEESIEALLDEYREDSLRSERYEKWNIYDSLFKDVK